MRLQCHCCVDSFSWLDCWARLPSRKPIRLSSYHLSGLTPIPSPDHNADLPAPGQAHGLRSFRCKRHTLTVPIPGAPILSRRRTAACSYATPNVVCSFGTLPANTDKFITITMTVAAAGGSTLTSTAVASATGRQIAPHPNDLSKLRRGSGSNHERNAGYGHCRRRGSFIGDITRVEVSGPLFVDSKGVRDLPAAVTVPAFRYMVRAQIRA